MSSTIDVDKSITAKELATLINDAPQGATLKFEAGEYQFDDSIMIARSDISLVGAGSDKTTLTFTDKALDRNDSYGLQLDGSDSQFIGKLDASADEGSRSLTLDNGDALQAGDTVRIWQDNDSAYFDDIGDNSWRETNAPLRTSMAKVASVNGDSVTLDRGVHFDFDGGKTKVERLDTIDNVSLKGFSLGFDLGTPDDGAFKNTLSGLKDYQALGLSGTTNSQLTDIQVINGPSIAYHFDRNLDVSADKIAAHGTFNKGGGGNGYAFELRESYDGNYTNLEDSGMRHGLIFASWRSSVNNDAHVSFTDRDINFHGGREHGNTVRVEQSVRDPDNDEMSTTLWINRGGESFGAITDAKANSVVFDYVVGSRRDDVLQGSDDGVYLNGGLGHDTLNGGKGDDILQGGPTDDWGKNTLNGGAGNDKALYFQDYADVDVDIKGDKATIDKDTLIDIEQAVFGDGTILDLASGNTSKGGKASAPSAADILGSGGSSTSSSAPRSMSGDQTSDAPESTQDTTSGASVTITSRITSAWNDGYVAEVFVENTSDSAITDPEVQFDLPAEIDTVWNGLVSQENGSYRVTDNSANTLESGEVWRFSYKAYGDDQSLPEGASLVTEEDNSASSDDPSQPKETTQASKEDNNTSTSADTAASAEVSITSRTTSAWNDGYVAEVFVENTSDSAITNPEVQFDLPAEIDTVWNGLVSQEDGSYRVTDNSANTLESGEVWRFSYKAYGDDQSLPEGAALVTEGDNSASSDAPSQPEEPAKAPEEDNSASASADTVSNADVTITSRTTSAWNDGYVAEVFIENTSDSVITDPAVQFDLPAEIDTVWNGLVSQQGDSYRVTADGAKELESGEVWRFSYKAYGDDQSLPEGTALVTKEDNNASVSANEEHDSASASADTASSADVTVARHITSAWNDGYSAEVFVKNTSDSAITNPEMQFDLPAEIDTVWNGLVSQAGDGYHVTDNNANVLDPGEVWRFAYKAYGDDQSLPDEASLQGDGTQPMEVEVIGIDSAQADTFSA